MKFPRQGAGEILHPVFMLHNAGIYRTTPVKRIWLALCSRVARKL